jgi:hypothetical protein
MEDRGRETAFLVEQREHQVLGVDLLISVLNGDGLGGSNRLL